MAKSFAQNPEEGDGGLADVVGADDGRGDRNAGSARGENPRDGIERNAPDGEGRYADVGHGTDELDARTRDIRLRGTVEDRSTAAMAATIMRAMRT